MLIGQGRADVMTLPVLVYNEYMSEMGGNANMASTLSVIIVACSLSVLLIQKFFVGAQKLRHDLDAAAGRDRAARL